MKKFFSIAMAALAIVACTKPAADNNTANNGGNNGGNEGGNETTEIVVSLSADAAFVDGKANVTATLSAANTKATVVTLEVASDSEVPAANLTLPSPTVKKGELSATGVVEIDIKGLEAGEHTAKIVAKEASNGAKIGDNKTVSIKVTVEAGDVTPSIPQETRNGKVYKADPVCSENALFNYTGNDAQGNAQFNTENVPDLGAGATFQVKFWANSWKNNAVDRLCCFEMGDEAPAMLCRFSCDGTSSGQFRFNNNAWQIGGSDGVKLTDEEENPYIFAAQKWHVLTMVLTPGENDAVTVEFYDNDTYINKAEGKKSKQKPNFYLQRFEFGMSWEYNFDNTTFPVSQKFDGFIDYARVWNRTLSKTEIINTLCDVKDNQKEGLLAYWIMNDGAGDGVIENRGNGGAAYNIDWSKMSEMNGGTYRKNLDLKANFLENLVDMDPANLCQF